MTLSGFRIYRKLMRISSKDMMQTVTMNSLFNLTKKLLIIYKNYTMIKSRRLKNMKNLHVTYKKKKCNLKHKIKVKVWLPQKMKKRYAFKYQIN